MKSFGIFLVALVGVTGQSNGASVAQSFGQKVSQSAAQALVTGVRSITPKTLCAGFIAGSALLGVGIHSQINNQLKEHMEYLEKRSKESPVLDCPIKQQITRKFAEQGYEVFFVNQFGTPDNAAVLRYGKKVAFFVFGTSNENNFFTAPHLADARDGIIEHELGHVVNGDTAGRVLAWSIAGSALLAATGCAAIAAASYDPSTLIEKLMSLSSVSERIKAVCMDAAQKGTSSDKNYRMAVVDVVAGVTEYAVKQAAGLTTRFGAAYTATTAAGTTGAIAAQLGIMAHSRYQEKRADYRAVAQAQAQNKPEMLEGMARFFERMAKEHGITEKKTWEQWWFEKMHHTHPCCCDRHRYLMKEAGKIRAKQAELQNAKEAAAQQKKNVAVALIAAPVLVPFRMLKALGEKLAKRKKHKEQSAAPAA